MTVRSQSPASAHTDGPATTTANAAQLHELARTVRRHAPLVHNITNLVMQNDTADAIAAVGGTQVTLHTEEEAAEATASSAALAVNSGTLNAAWLRAAHSAVGVAVERKRPWVLDPVAAGLTRYRTAAARELLARHPTVLKANPSEILVLANAAAGGRGADSLHSVAQARDAARALARRDRCIVAVTGATDLVTDGERLTLIANGRPLLGAMIGSGCMLTSVLACFLAASDDVFAATVAAIGYFTVAGELATEQAAGPGSLKPLLIDSLYNLDRTALEARLRLQAQP